MIDPCRLLALAALLTATGCSDCGDSSESSLPAVAGPHTAHGEQGNPLGQATRPKRRYYVDNTDNQCAVFWTTEDQRSIRRTIRCPREVEPAERLRLAGRVCFRESTDVARQGPVRCPPDILRADRDDRADAGEYLLPEKTD